MLSAVQISGFRGFRSLQMDGLARVNLLVGRNNTGKSSVLEAIEVLMGSADALLRVAANRGERAYADDLWVPAVSHMFHGHQLGVGSEFELRSLGSPQVTCRVKVVEAAQQHLPLGDDEISPELALEINSSLVNVPVVIPLVGAEGGVKRYRPRFLVDGLPRVQTLGTGTIDDKDINRLWDAVVLTPDEDRVLDAMRVVEPRIEGLAFLSASPARSAWGAVVKLEGIEPRVPLGTMGDGVKRLLAIALVLTQSAGGFLLVDEIDTSLHHSVMAPMWRLVLETAKRLDVQVFATTHSQDGLASLEALCAGSPELRGDVAVYRIDRQLERAVRYSGEELTIALEQELEIRG